MERDETTLAIAILSNAIVRSSASTSALQSQSSNLFFIQQSLNTLPRSSSSLLSGLRAGDQSAWDVHAPYTYQEALDALSSLIMKRSRAEKSNKGDRYDLMYEYLKILDLEEDISRMKIIHVAGTKGKGSTCVFTESILRHCGFRTGLFTSPHLIDVRERFRLDGVDVCEKKFLANFWWCYEKLKEKADEEMPMPTYFRFLTLLAFKIFAGEQVDVVILEVGLGGRFDATNVVRRPVVCGISSLGYDHMEILGNTLAEIAREKAGIFKNGTPAFSVPQPDEAMCVLVDEASKLDVNLQVAEPLSESALNGEQLGLEGEHQYLNAGLAVRLSSTWLQRTGHLEVTESYHTNSTPKQFIQGLINVSFQGRAQIIADQLLDVKRPGGLVYYLDGAHSPESMDACARWFSLAIKHERKRDILNYSAKSRHPYSQECEEAQNGKKHYRDSQQILLFNCMPVRDPLLLLPPLRKTCANYGVHFTTALFVPNTSVYYKVGSHTSPNGQRVDLSSQFRLQRLWESLMQGREFGQRYSIHGELKDDTSMSITSCEHSVVFSSLPMAIKWLRDRVEQSRSIRLQVLVTGSLHLVGDVLRLVKK